MRGKKFDNGKLLWHLLDMTLLEDTVKVLMHGAVKYKADNWKKVKNAEERYQNALDRHWVAWKAGEVKDSDSGLPHLAHIMCNALFLTYFEKNKFGVIVKFIDTNTVEVELNK